MILAVSPVFSPAVSKASAENTGHTVGVSTVSATSANRLGGIDRYETAAKVAQEGWRTSEYAVLSAGMDANLVDALTAAPLAQTKNAPILLTQGDALNEYAQAELSRLGVKTVYVTSGTGVITQKVLDKLTQMHITVVSLGGSDRFETAVNIAKQLGEPKRIVVTTAWGNADALSVASIAAAKGMPILLANLHELPGSVKGYIDSIQSNLIESYVIGGPGVVSEAVQNSLPNSQRAGGNDRYATNLEILKLFANDLKYSKTYLANGENPHLVDSLAGAPLAARSSSPILLTRNQLSTASKDYAKSNLSPNIVVLGGESVVPNQVVTELTSAAIFTEAGAVLGSDDANVKKTFGESLTISGDNITLKNAIADYGVSINGNNVTLSNVTVKGTVFVDPGETGTATLDTVNAANVVVLSGAAESIHLKNVVAQSLKVASSNNVRVESSGTTSIAATVVNSAAIIDVAGGSIGQVQIGNAANQAVPEVELKGNFDKPVVVNGSAVVKAAGTANIAKLEVAPENKEQKVTLEGVFKSVQINLEAKVELGKTAVVQELVTNAKAEINVQAGAKVDKFDKKGNSVNLTGDGASAVPASGSTTTTLPAGGGGGGGSGDILAVGAVSITTDPVNVSGLANNATVTVTLTTATAEAAIYYTTDGSTPSASSTRYNPAGKPSITTSNQFGETIVFKAIGVKSGMNNSAVAEQTIVFNSATLVNVSSAAQLHAAIQDNNIGTIIVNNSFVGNVSATRSGSNNFAVDFDDKTMTGNLTVTANSVTSITFHGTASPSIDGNLTVSASSATVNNNMNVGGTINIQAVSSNTWNQNGDAGKVDITANGGSFNRTGGRITDGVSIRPSASDNPIQLKGNMGGIPVVVEAPANIEIAPDVDNPPNVIVEADAAGSEIENFKDAPLPLTANGNVAVGGQIDVQAGSTAAITERQVRPTFNPAAGAVAFGTTVVLVSSGADAIYYTTDGSDPTMTSTNQAITPLVISSEMTVKAMAVRAGKESSRISTAAYTQAASADLINIVLSGSPSGFTFAGETYMYENVTVPYSQASVTVTPTGAGTITVNGTTVTSGDASAAINLTAGQAEVVTVAARETGKSTKTYVIKVKRASAPGGPAISSLTTTKDTVTIGFSENIVSINLPNSVTFASGTYDFDVYQDTGTETLFRLGHYGLLGQTANSMTVAVLGDWGDLSTGTYDFKLYTGDFMTPTVAAQSNDFTFSAWSDANTSVEAIIYQPSQIYVTVAPLVGGEAADPLVGLVQADFSLFDGAGNQVDFNFAAGSEVDENLPAHEYCLTPISGTFDGVYRVRFAKTGYNPDNTIFTVEQTETVAINQISEATMDMRKGSIIMGYTFSSGAEIITYEQAISDAYALDLASSSVTLGRYDGAGYTQIGNTVYFSALSIGNSDVQGESAKVTFADPATLLNAFGLNIDNPANVPTHVKVVVQSKTSIAGKEVDNAWGPIDSGWVEIDSEVMNTVSISAENSTASVAPGNKTAGISFPVAIHLKDDSNTNLPDGQYPVQILNGASPVGGGAEINFTDGQASVDVILAAEGNYTLVVKANNIEIESIAGIVAVSSPVLVSSTTTMDGTQIHLTFSKAMADPTGKENQFTVMVNDTENTVTAIALSTGDSTTLELTLTNALVGSETITIAYTQGDVAAADGGILCTFMPVPVTSAIPPNGDLLDADAGAGFSGVLYTRDGNIYYNQADASSTWGDETLIGAGTEGSMAVDSTGKPHVVYTTSGKIGYRMYDGSGWTEEVLIESNYGGTCSMPDIAVDGNGYAHITYTDTMGNTGDYTDKPDIMYANNTSGSFAKVLIFRGYLDYYGGADRYAEGFGKGSLIALDAGGNYFIMAHKDTYMTWMGGNDRTYSIVVNSNLGNGSIGASSTDDIYDLMANGGKVMALYLQSTFKTSELTVTGDIISFTNTGSITGTSVSTVRSDGTNVIVGGISSTNLQIHYNGSSTVYDGITVGGLKVALVNLNGAFYAVYTDSSDHFIKMQLIELPPQ